MLVLSRTGLPILTDTQIQIKKAHICGPFLFGTRGRTRTGTLLRAGDFESPVSTNFTTLAWEARIIATVFASSTVYVEFVTFHVWSLLAKFGRGFAAVIWLIK